MSPNKNIIVSHFMCATGLLESGEDPKFLRCPCLLKAFPKDMACIGWRKGENIIKDFFICWPSLATMRDKGLCATAESAITVLEGDKGYTFDKTGQLIHWEAFNPSLPPVSQGGVRRGWGLLPHCSSLFCLAITFVTMNADHYRNESVLI